MHDYDPGEPYDGPPPRRRRDEYRRENEQDDAWAAAGDDAGDYDVDPADLAAGYNWQDDNELGARRSLDRGDTAPSDQWYRRRGTTPPVRSPRFYTPYPDSPSYQQDQGRTRPPRSAYAASQTRAPGMLSHFPCWAIALIVFLGIMALFAVTLACMMVLAL